jgi:hypothetical protein
MMDDFQIVFFVDSLAFWCIAVMHNPAIVKENSSTLTLLRTRRAFLDLGDEECFYCDDCTFVSGSYPYTHVSSPVITVFRNSGSLLVQCNATSTYYSTSLTSCLGEKGTLGEATTNHACAWRSPPPLWSDLPTCHHWFFREKIKSDTFWTGLVNCI